MVKQEWVTMLEHREAQRQMTQQTFGGLIYDTGKAQLTVVSYELIEVLTRVSICSNSSGSCACNPAGRLYGRRVSCGFWPIQTMLLMDTGHDGYNT